MDRTRRTIPKSVKDAVWNYYIGAMKVEGPCNVCGKTIHMRDFDVGHNVAKSKGGGDDPGNLRPICRSCNLSMGTQSIESFKAGYFPEVTNPPGKRADPAPTQAPSEVNPSPQPRENPLTLKVVNHKIEKDEHYWGYHLTLAPKVEAYSSAYVKVWELVLVLGGQQIEEEGAPDPRELLVPRTWDPVFSIPEWARGGTHKVWVGALLVKRPRYDKFIHGMYPSAYDCWDSITMSNIFEVTIPEWPTPEMKAEDEARRRYNRENNTLEVGVP